MIISRKNARAKPMAEGSPQYSVYRSLQGEPTVNARLMDPTCKFLYVEFTISELRDMLKIAENANVVKEWDREQIAANIRIMDKGHELIEEYRGFHIGGKGLFKIGVYKNGESYSMNYLPSVSHARAYIDRLIKSGFIEWFARYGEARDSRGLKAPPSRDRAAAAFHAQRDPEDLALDDLMDASRYSVEQQQDGTWAIFNGGGFTQGGYPDRGEAVFAAKQRIEADIECGVPVIREVA